MVETNNLIKVLKFFMDNSFLSFTILKVSKELEINYRIAYEEVKKLEKKGLIKIEKVGNSNICSFNPKFSPETLKVENIKKELLLDNKNINLITKRLEEVEYPFFIFLVFGSYASFSKSKNSDIDICLICDNEKIMKKIEVLLRLFSFKIHLLTFTTSEFQSMLDSKKENVGKEILKNRIILKGEQAFYNL